MVRAAGAAERLVLGKGEESKLGSLPATGVFF